MKAHAKRIEGMAFALDDGRGHAVVADLPPDIRGTDLGPKPSEMALMSLVGCIGVTYLDIAHNKELDVKDMDISVEAEKDMKGFTKIMVKAVVYSNDEKKATRIFDNTLSICTVGVLFRKAGVEETHELEIRPY